MDNGTFDSYQEANGLDKTMNFFRKNAYTFLLVLVSIAFLFKELITIGESGKTVVQILADSALSFTMGMTFKIILGKKGLLAGQAHQSYRAALGVYAEQMDKTNENIDELDNWCEKKNNERLKIAQTRVLRTGKIKYDDFANNRLIDMTLTEKQIKVWRKTERVRIRYLNSDNLLSETDARYDKGKKELTLQQYEGKKNSISSISTVVCAVIFGYFTVVPNYDNVANLIWGVIQVSLWTIMGLLTYIQNYTYVKDVYLNKIYRKINYLIEFNKFTEKERGKESWQTQK